MHASDLAGCGQLIQTIPGCNRENFGGVGKLFAVLPVLLNHLTESTFPSPTCSSCCLVKFLIHSNRQITEFNFNKPSFTIIKKNNNWGAEIPGPHTPPPPLYETLHIQHVMYPSQYGSVGGEPCSRLCFNIDMTLKFKTPFHKTGHLLLSLSFGPLCCYRNRSMRPTVSTCCSHLSGSLATHSISSAHRPSTGRMRWVCP